MKTTCGYLAVVGTFAIWGANFASAVPSQSDDLYSETVYIQRSSIEVPESIDSSAKATASLNINTKETIESMTDLDNEAAAPKVSDNREVKKSVAN